MKNLNRFLLLVILWSCAACQSDVPQTDKSKPTTFANLYVRYLQGEKKAKATATFRSGFEIANSEPLQFKNGVFFHNGNMTERTIKNVGVRYNYDFAGDFAEAFPFRFEDPLLGKINHEVRMNPILNYKVEGNISQSKGATITWEGVATAEHESFVVIILDAKNNTVPFETKGKMGTNEIFIPAEKLKKLSKGNGKISIVRKQVTTTEKPNLVIISEMEFYTKDLTVQIVS